MPWTVTVRVRGRVRRARHDELDTALEALELEARTHTGAARREPLDLRVRRFEPEQQVVARVEVKGPQRFVPAVRAGVDVHGDGSVKAYLGSMHRSVIKPGRGESVYDALRRSMQDRLSDGRPSSSSRR